MRFRGRLKKVLRHDRQMIIRHFSVYMRPLRGTGPFRRRTPVFLFLWAQICASPKLCLRERFLLRMSTPVIAQPGGLGSYARLHFSEMKTRGRSSVLGALIATFIFRI